MYGSVGNAPSEILRRKNTVLKKRIWASGKIIADIHGSTTYYALGDTNKNITEYLDNTGTIQAHYEYSPFGKITKKTGTMQDNFDYRFSSEVFDIETNLVYYNYRYYSPTLGRWTKRDPIGEKGGWNLYGMVYNNPINRWDKLGLAGCCGGKKIPRGKACCANKRIYDPRSRCCINATLPFRVSQIECNRRARKCYKDASKLTGYILRSQSSNTLLAVAGTSLMTTAGGLGGYFLGKNSASAKAGAALAGAPGAAVTAYDTGQTIATMRLAYKGCDDNLALCLKCSK